MLWKYLAGAAASRAGDEMTGPALLLLGFAITGRPGTGSVLLACLTGAAAAGRPAVRSDARPQPAPGPGAGRDAVGVRGRSHRAGRGGRPGPGPARGARRAG